MGSVPRARRSAALLGRDRELAALDGFISAVRRGEGRQLVVAGEPGVGKTALLEHVAERAPGCRVARSTGVQSEIELAFAGLLQLCAPMLDRLPALPRPQADALRIAFGMGPGRAPDRFLVGLAVLNLLSDVAEDQPLICLVDDAQWLDRASTHALSFVARRLEAEPVGLIFSTRLPGADVAASPTLIVAGLRDPDARALLESELHWPLDGQVRDRIVAEARGNPLAVKEMARGLSPGTVAGGFELPSAEPLAGAIETSFRRQIDSLPSEAKRLIHLAAADPVGDPVVVWKAAERLAIPADAATPAAEVGLLVLDARVRFGHPLVRSAAYRSTPLHERHALHRALAEATPETDPDRRAWHRAKATPGPDEDVAAELEASADRAQARGGVPAAAAFLESAALLSPEPTARVRRALAAASAHRDAGALDEALALIATAEATALDPRAAAEAECLRGRIALDQGRLAEAAGLLRHAAASLDPLDASEAREVHLEALQTAIWLDDLDHPGGIRAAAAAARAGAEAPRPPRAVDVLLDAWAIRMTDGYTAALPYFTVALDLLRGLSESDDPGQSLSAAVGSNAHAVALELWDDASWNAILAGDVRLARERGATVHLQHALNNLAWSHLFAGELDIAARLLDEDRTIAAATGNPAQPWTDPGLAAWRGREEEASASIEGLTRLAVELGFGAWLTVARLATSVLSNGLGRHDEALDAARPLLERASIGHTFVVFELAEAASRTADEATVGRTLAWMSERARAIGGDWALGTEAVIRALLSRGQVAERHYREGITRLARTRMRPYLARTHLLYGEWLRRERRRIDAREQLGTAYELLSAMGIEAFAERARHELMATGVTARKRTAETIHELTAQEAHIARLARDGLSNPEIGSRLFISPRTVKYHLSKVYTKLAITSREQLDDVLPVQPT